MKHRILKSLLFAFALLGGVLQAAEVSYDIAIPVKVAGKHSTFCRNLHAFAKKHTHNYAVKNGKTCAFVPNQDQYHISMCVIKVQEPTEREIARIEEILKNILQETIARYAYENELTELEFLTQAVEYKAPRAEATHGGVVWLRMNNEHFAPLVTILHQKLQRHLSSFDGKLTIESLNYGAPIPHITLNFVPKRVTVPGAADANGIITLNANPNATPGFREYTSTSIRTVKRSGINLLKRVRNGKNHQHGAISQYDIAQLKDRYAETVASTYDQVNDMTSRFEEMNVSVQPTTRT